MFEEKQSRQKDHSAREPLKIDSPDSVHEKEAEQAAHTILHGDQLSFAGSSAGSNNNELSAPEEVASAVREKKGSGTSLSTELRQQMEPGLGADLSGVHLHTGEEADALTDQVGAHAFTVGQDVFLGTAAKDTQKPEGKHILAHELQHTKQQKENGGEEKMQRYVKYSRREQMRLMPGDKNYDKYKERKEKKSDKHKKMLQGWRHPEREPLLVSNDGKMAVEGTAYTTAKQAWADKNLIDKSNQVLKAQKSYIELVPETNDLEVGAVPKDGSENTAKSDFRKIKVMHNKKDMTDPGVTSDMMMNNNKHTMDDCGYACEMITGSMQVTEGDKTKTGDEALDKGTSYMRYLVSGGSMAGVIVHEYYDTESGMAGFIQKIMLNEAAYKDDKKVQASPLDAYTKYLGLSSTDRDALDKKYGLNKYARPTLGGGITIVNPYHAGRKKENQQVAKKNEGLPAQFRTQLPYRDLGVNYHYASNIMDSGSDYMVFEAYVTHENWYFYMYGEDAGQTFFDNSKDAVHDATSGLVSPTNPTQGGQNN